MAELQDNRLYNIIPLVSPAPTGVNNLLPVDTQIVRLGGDGNVWRITRNLGGPNLYYFSIANKYGYSGVDENRKVIATSDPNKNTFWYLSDRGIAWEADHDLVWTVADPSDANSEIVLRKAEGLPTQRFDYRPVAE